MIRKQKITSLPVVNINSNHELSKHITEIRRHQELAWDTEFVGEKTYIPDLCLIQLATSSAIYLIDPISCDHLEPFWELITNDKHTIVTHAAREEIRLCRHATGQQPSNIIDLQIAAGLIGYNYPLSYSNLIQETLGIKLTKSETLSDWSQRPLSKDQLNYAADDVRYLLPAWEKIARRSTQLNRTDWLDEEMADLLTKANMAEVDEERWRKLKGLGQLTRPQLSIARELYYWRDRLALEQNRPMRSILRDDLIIEICRRNPSNPRDLKSLRGIPNHFIDSILSAIQYAQSRTDHPTLLKKDIESRSAASIRGLLTLVLEDIAHEKKIANSIIATQSDLKELIRSYQSRNKLSTKTILNRGWRRREILPTLTEILSGQISIRIGHPRSDSPLERFNTPLDQLETKGFSERRTRKSQSRKELE